jgi:hypothetical protein
VGPPIAAVDLAAMRRVARYGALSPGGGIADALPKGGCDISSLTITMAPPLRGVDT